MGVGTAESGVTDADGGIDASSDGDVMADAEDIDTEDATEPNVGVGAVIAFMVGRGVGRGVGCGSAGRSRSGSMDKQLPLRDNQ